MPCPEAEGGRAVELAMESPVAGLGGVVGARRRAVPWRKCLVRWPESLVWRTSVDDRSAWPRIVGQVAGHSHPRTRPIEPDKDGIPFPGDRHAGRGGPPWCRWVSRSPAGAPADRREAPISRWGSGRWCPGRRRGSCPRDGGGGPRRRGRMLGDCVSACG